MVDRSVVLPEVDVLVSPDVTVAVLWASEYVSVSDRCVQDNVCVSAGRSCVSVRLTVAMVAIKVSVNIVAHAV